MQTFKRPRQAVGFGSDEDRDVTVATSSTRLEPQERPRQQKRPRVSGPQTRRRVTATPSPDDDTNGTTSDSSDAEQSAPAGRHTSPQRTQYEIARDGNFEHLQYADQDLERATQQIRSRPTRVVENNHPADGGVIERVECVNFMCHERLIVELGPLINFIVGENGSGKSAVLTALTLCLGGKTSATNRGGNLKNFIKEGRDHATISVKVTNRGLDAFQPEIYGDHVIVERHFSRHGGSGFRLKSSSGKVVSIKKAHVDELSEWYCLQMDNPLNVLSQDNARQFLNTATPAQKYKFFVQGVQLEQLDNDYRIVGEFTQHLENKLEAVAEDVEASKDRWRTAQKLRETVDKNEEMRQKLRLYVNQLAWAQVAEQERLLAQREEAIEQADHRIGEAERTIQDKSQVLDAADEQLQRANDAVEANKSERDRYAGKISEAAESFQAASKDLQHIHTEERDLYGRLKYASDEVNVCKAKIGEEETRLDQSSGSARLEKEAELETKKALEQDLESRISQTHQRQSDLRTAEVDGQKHLQDFENGPLRAVRTRLDQTSSRIEQLKEHASSRLVGFEPKMPQLVARIENDRSFHSKPLGPLGAHIHLLRPQWAGIIEAQLGQSLSGFIVTSLQDQKRLRDLMSSVGVSAPIFISTGYRLDPGGKEPDDRHETILRVLKFDDDLIRDQLIINSFIEQIVLEEDRRQASDIVLSGSHNVKFCLSYLDHKKEIGLRTVRNASGEVSTSPVNPRRGRMRMRTDEKAHLGLEQEKKNLLAQEYRELQDEQHQHLQRLDRINADASDQAAKIARLKTNLRHAQAAVADVQAQLDSFEGVDGRLQSLRDELAKWEEEKETYGLQYGNMHLQKRDLNKKAEQCRTVLDEAKAAATAHELKQRKLEDKAQRFASSRAIALSEKNQAHEAADAAQGAKKRAIEKRDGQRGVVENFVDEAQKCAPERAVLPEDETFHSIEKKYKALRNQLKQRERAQGASDAEIYTRAEAARNEHEALCRIKTSIMRDLDGLKSSLENRHDRWRTFQRQISARTRAQFALLLAQRKCRGDVILDHRARKLALQVEPDITQDVGTGRSTKTLSGGEKSFASICLLLSVWEAMGSPIRCLDEFDVFMDNLNRAISTNMLIEAARRSVSRQYILITPNAIEGRARLAKDVKIIRLTDPRQRTLPGMLEPSH